MFAPYISSSKPWAPMTEALLLVPRKTCRMACCKSFCGGSLTSSIRSTLFALRWAWPGDDHERHGDQPEHRQQGQHDQQHHAAAGKKGTVPICAPAPSGPFRQMGTAPFSLPEGLEGLGIGD